MLSLLNFFKIDIPKNRIFGLDLLRAIAILLVLFGHSKHFLPINIAYFLNKYILINGVGLFFVLSSFLIGGIFIKDFEKKIHLSNISFLLSTLIYKYFEIPTTKLRDKK